MGMQNKRKEKRIEEENKLRCEIISCQNDTEHKRIFSTLTKDISLGGINIRTDSFLPVDTVVRIELSLPKMHKIVCVRGKVKWVKSLYDGEIFEMGIEFVNPPPLAITSLIGHLYGVASV
jgi:c-di-GMP-binding flagellar brake protein YcgR